VSLCVFRAASLKSTKGTYSLTQPTICPLFDTKQFQDVLMSLNGMSGTYYDYIKAIHLQLFRATWKIVHDGVYVGAAQSYLVVLLTLVLLQVH
jgi:molybdopterin-containing oxidoreductase family iron-sulfur binding subunit